jgi:hypothetical protein
MAKAHVIYGMSSSFLLFLGACVCASTPHGYTAATAPGVQVIQPNEADAAGLEGHAFQLAYGQVPGDKAMLAHFLGVARQKGAAFVSNIEVHVVDDKDGRWEECVTRLLPADRGRRRARTRLVPGYYEDVVVPVSVGGSGFAETKVTCPTSTGTDGCIQSTGSGGSSIVYRTETRHIPAHWSTEVQWVSDWTLEETAPSCKPVARSLSASAPARLVRATVYER